MLRQGGRAKDFSYEKIFHPTSLREHKLGISQSRNRLREFLDACLRKKNAQARRKCER